MDIICASICYRGWAEDEVAATLQYAPTVGYRHMEIHGPMVWSTRSAMAFDLPRVKAMIAASGIRCAGLYPPSWGGVDAADVEARAQAIAHCVAITRELGGSHIATTGAEAHDIPGALDRVIACARRVLALVPADSPVKLALEPHYGNVLQNWDDFERCMDAIADPRLGVCVDTGHFHSAKVDTVGFIHRFGTRIHAVHLKDHVSTISVGIGRGEIDLAAQVGALREVGYSRGLTIELEVEDPQNLPRYTEEAYFYVSGLLGQNLWQRGE